MKRILLLLTLLTSFTVFAQKECEYTVMETEEGKQLKSTKEYLMYEKTFAGTSQFLFFSLTNSEGVPILNFQQLSKSKDFPKMYCLDKASRIYLQLMNGKIITLIYALDEQCSGLIYDETEKNNIRILTGSFLFTKGSFEELEQSPITFMRVKYASETVDYPIRKEIENSSNEQKYNPESFFIDYLKCIK
jgi:hypothetical protein